MRAVYGADVNKIDDVELYPLGSTCVQPINEGADEAEFIYCVVPAGTYVRYADAVYINEDYEVSVVNTSRSPVNAISYNDVNAIEKDKFAWFIRKSRCAEVAIYTFETSLSKTIAIPYKYGQITAYNDTSFNVVNNAKVVPGTKTYITKTNTNLAAIFSIGDVLDLVDTNGYAKVVGYDGNNILVIADQISTNVNTNITLAVAEGGALFTRSGIIDGDVINEIYEFSGSGVNIVSSGTTLTANTNVFGTQIKPGEVITDGTNSVKITSITNATTATCNASNVWTTGVVDFNVITNTIYVDFNN